MSYIGGDVLEVSYKHPTLGDGSFFVKAGEDTTIDLGGYRTDDDANGIAGNGEMITKINAVRWSYEAPIAWSKTTTNELKVLADMAADPQDADWTIRSIDLSVFAGKGRPVGDLAGATQDSTIPLKISGGRGLRRL